jgi:EAL domain-containing protein (putative c-di-GMP-specific phosphodiesterase class I)
MHALAEAGIDLGQGFVFSRPVADAETSKLLGKHWIPAASGLAIA